MSESYTHFGNREEMIARYRALEEVTDARIAKLEAELAEARGVVERLPKTADGVPVTHGMTTFYISRAGMFSRGGVVVESEPWAIRNRDGRPIDNPIMQSLGPKYYSTREAAQAAASGGGA